MKTHRSFFVVFSWHFEVRSKQKKMGFAAAVRLCVYCIVLCIVYDSIQYLVIAVGNGDKIETNNQTIWSVGYLAQKYGDQSNGVHVFSRFLTFVQNMKYDE